MPFSLSRAETTYRSLVKKMFANLIGKIMEIYVDDMLLKGLKVDDYVEHLNETFQIQMKLKPLK